jgi:hypothetical protein
MTITTQRPPVPTDLPISRLFLDDLEDIVSILVGAAGNIRVEGPDYPVTKEMSVNTRTCTEIAELPEITRKTVNNFEIKVLRGHYFRGELSIRPYSSRLTTYGELSDAERRGLFQLVDGIFERRKLRWRMFWDGLPAWVFGVGSIVAYICVMLVFWLLAHFVSILWALGIDAVAVTIFAIVLLLPRSRGGEVIFSHSSERGKLRHENRQKIGWEIFKAVLYIVGTIAAALFLHRYWPSIKP